MSAKAQKGQPSKILRIGIVQSGKVIHERLIRPGQDVTIGESPKNTFVFTSPSLTKNFTLFMSQGSRYYLNFNETIKGRIAYRDSIAALDQLRDQGEATRKGPHYVLPLSEQNRGKIVIDDITILFQFVNPPPESARMLTRHDFRPKLLDEDDPVFFAFLGLFSSVATVVMIWAMNQSPPERVDLGEIPDRFVEIVMANEDNDPEPPAIEPVEDPDIVSPEAPPEEQPPEEQPPEEAPEEQRQEMSPEDRARAEAQRIQEKKEALTTKSALLGMIGTRGENNSGSSVEDVFQDGDSSFSNLEDALQDVGAVDIASTENIATRGQEDAGGRGDASLGSVSQAGGGDAAVSSAPQTVVRNAEISTSGVDIPTGESADQIRSVLNRKSGQVKYCYEQRLKENPNLSGRIAVEVSITAGRVTLVDVIENTTNDSALETCVIRKVRGWQFPSDVDDDIYLPFALTSN